MPTKWLSDFLKEGHRMPEIDPYDSWDFSPYQKSFELVPTSKKTYLLKMTLPMKDSSGMVAKQISDFLGKDEEMTFEHLTEETYTPDHILKSGNRTIVFWKDGTKTIVKRTWLDIPSDYNAFCVALAIKIFGNNSQLKKMLKGKTFIQVKMENGKTKVCKKKDMDVPTEGYEQ